MAKLKKVTPHDRLIVGVKRKMREINLLLAEYEAETADYSKQRRERPFFQNPHTGKKTYIKMNRT